LSSSHQYIGIAFDSSWDHPSNYSTELAKADLFSITRLGSPGKKVRKLRSTAGPNNRI
jgi:hypothetical protein